MNFFFCTCFKHKLVLLFHHRSYLVILCQTVWSSLDKFLPLRATQFERIWRRLPQMICSRKVQPWFMNAEWSWSWWSHPSTTQTHLTARVPTALSAVPCRPVYSPLVSRRWRYSNLSWQNEMCDGDFVLIPIPDSWWGIGMPDQWMQDDWMRDPPPFAQHAAQCSQACRMRQTGKGTCSTLWIWWEFAFVLRTITIIVSRLSRPSWLSHQTVTWVMTDRLNASMPRQRVYCK